MQGPWLESDNVCNSGKRILAFLLTLCNLFMPVSMYAQNATIVHRRLRNP